MKSIFLVIVLIFGFTSCELDKAVDDISESLMDERFQKCYYENDFAQNKCDSVLISIFGNSLFKKSIKLDLFHSSMNCEVDGELKQVLFGNLDYCVPNSYDLSYSIRVKDESIFSFNMIAGKDMQFEVVSTVVEEQLRGYRELLAGKFKINYSGAKKIALENGVNLEDFFLELVKLPYSERTGEASYFWEAELESDASSLTLFHIDVITGESTVKTVFLIPPESN